MKRTAFMVLCAGLGVAACSLQPPAVLPAISSGEQWHESGPWLKADADAWALRGQWWAVYGNAELDTLENKLIDANPTLAVAVANHAQAEAIVEQASAVGLPQLGLSAGGTRSRGSKDLANSLPHPLFNTMQVVAGFFYYLDLWGRLRSQVAAARASEAASLADLADARLSLGAALAESYVQLRSLDADAAILEKAVAAYQRALDLTHRRHDQGIAPGLDVAQAEAQLQTASSQLEQTRARRALTEHAIAALVGEPASRFSVSPAVVDLSLPAIPTGLPSTLLQRRPDVAAARSRVEAANAAIGVAKAAWFPSLVLGGQYGYQSSRLGNLISAPSTVWAWGPAAAVAVFDGGLRRGLERQAQAEFDASAAQYRVVALAAFQQVEDQLALLNHYGEASKSEEAAVQAAKRALRFSEELYRQGATDYLTVVASQTSALQAERDALTLTTDRLLASVTLIRALGGGWSSETDKAGTPTTVAVNPRAPGQAENLPPAPAAETPAGR